MVPICFNKTNLLNQRYRLSLSRFAYVLNGATTQTMPYSYNTFIKCYKDGTCRQLIIILCTLIDRNLSHKNLVKLLGVSLDGNPIYIVTEYCGKVTLLVKVRSLQKLYKQRLQTEIANHKPTKSE